MLSGPTVVALTGMAECRGYLLRWTKGFDLQDGIGSDPVENLHAALRNHGRRGHIAALLNDGIGVFGAGRYLCSDTTVSFILGTGAYPIQVLCPVRENGVWRNAFPRNCVSNVWGPHTEHIALFWVSATLSSFCRFLMKNLNGSRKLDNCKRVVWESSFLMVILWHSNDFGCF